MVDNTTSVYLRRRHMAAIALNNTAVSLLVRGDCRSAMEVCNDAMKFIRTVTVLSEGEETNVSVVKQGGAGGMDDDVRLALDRAAQRTALCKNLQDGVLMTHMPILQVVSTQSNPTSIYDYVTSCAQCVSLPVAFPVTIDLIDYDESNGDADEVGFHAGVILYNYGIAHDCLAATAHPAAPSTPSVNALQTKALRIFQLSRALLSKVVDHDDNNKQDNNIPSLLGSRILFLQTFVTHHLIQVAIKLKLQLEYNEYCHVMEHLLPLLRMQQILLPIGDANIAGAA